MSAYTATSWQAIAFSKTGVLGHQRSKYHETCYKLTLPTGGEVPAAGVPLPPLMPRKTNTYILHNNHSLGYTTAAANTLRWEIKASGPTMQAYKYTSTSGTATTASGGRALRRLATTVTLTVSQVLYVSAIGY